MKMMCRLILLISDHPIQRSIRNLNCLEVVKCGVCYIWMGRRRCLALQPAQNTKQPSDQDENTKTNSKSKTKTNTWTNTHHKIKVRSALADQDGNTNANTTAQTNTRTNANMRSQ